MIFLRYFLLVASLIALSRAMSKSVNVKILHVDDDVQDMNGDLIEDPGGEVIEAINFATELALSAATALNDEFIFEHPAFQAIFGVHQFEAEAAAAITQLHNNYQRVADLFSPSNIQEVLVDIWNTTLPDDDGHIRGQTFASVENDRLSIWRDFWTALRDDELVPACVVERTLVGAQLDIMVTRASILLHELFHMTYIGQPQLLDADTNPVERSGGAAVLRMAQQTPGDAVNNPDSLMFFAIAVHYNIFARDRNDPSRFAPFDLGLGADVHFGDTELYRDPLAGHDAPPGTNAYWPAIHGIGSFLKA